MPRSPKLERTCDLGERRGEGGRVFCVSMLVLEASPLGATDPLMVLKDNRIRRMAGTNKSIGDVSLC